MGPAPAVRFVDFLKATVLLCAGAATALAAITVLSVSRAGTPDAPLLAFLVSWWLAAALIGAWLGRKAETTPPIARLLAGARTATTLPQNRPGTMLVNRLWPVLVSTAVALGLAFVAPQVPGIAVGFTIIWALAWRRQDAAVTAIEERDGVTFHLEATSPLKPIRLVRSPGLRRD